MNKPTHLILFAKAPLRGFSKTRLIPALGEDKTARLAMRLFHHAIDQAINAELGSVELCVTPGLDHECWREFDLPESLIITEQGEGDLGVRMSRAVQRAFETSQSVLIMGTDCPEIDAHYLREAGDELKFHDACLTPVSDGGYALMGLNAFHPSLFEGIPWSTEKVCSLTLERFRYLDWQVAHLRPLHDIDEPDDLRYLPKIFESDLCD